MEMQLGKALCGFSSALAQLRRALEPFPGVSAQLFSETAEWERLLTYKLLPHFEGEGCLVIAVAGGTNTGKSTAFDLLLGGEISPVRATAAATSRPLLAASAYRAQQCLEGRFAPEFDTKSLQDPADVLNGSGPENVLYVAQRPDLPDRMVLLDIPDIDSIERRHWELAENIQAAGDVLIAVLTGEKYQDDRVVTFFRRARAAGRVILPLMNKANPNNEYAVARAQLAEFCRAVDLEDSPCFVLPHDFDLLTGPPRPIASLNGELSLRAYLDSLDVLPIKQRVYRDTVTRFAVQSGEFLAHLEETSAALRGVAEEFDARAAAYAAKYDPEPGADVGSILHRFIQSKRGMVIRAVGWAGTAAGRVLSPAGRIVRKLLLPGNAPGKTVSADAEDLRARHVCAIETETRTLLREYLCISQNLHALGAGLVMPTLEQLDLEEAVGRVREAVLEPADVSNTFREHVERTLDSWWRDHAVRRMLLLELDALLMLSPAAVAVPLSFYSGGVGVPEVLAATSPLAGEFFARIMEHQFADKWFDLIAPWRREQQQRFEQAIKTHVTEPVLQALREAQQAIEGECAAALRRNHESCRQA